MNCHDAFRLDQESHQAAWRYSAYDRREISHSKLIPKTSSNERSISTIKSSRIVYSIRVSIEMNCHDAFRLDQESHQAAWRYSAYDRREISHSKLIPKTSSNERSISTIKSSRRSIQYGWVSKWIATTRFDSIKSLIRRHDDILHTIEERFLIRS